PKRKIFPAYPTTRRMKSFGIQLDACHKQRVGVLRTAHPAVRIKPRHFLKVCETAFNFCSFKIHAALTQSRRHSKTCGPGSESWSRKLLPPTDADRSCYGNR